MRCRPPHLPRPTRFAPLVSLAWLALGLVVLASTAAAQSVPIRNLHVNTSSGVPALPYAPGTTVQITGVVVSPDGVWTTTNNEVVVRDTTGAMTVFRSGGYSTYRYDLGDSVTVSGQITQFNGLTEVGNAVLLTKHSTGNGGFFLDPVVITCKQLRDSTFDFNTLREDRESQLIRINNVTVTGGTWPSTCSGANVTLTITDATGSATLFIDKDSPVCGMSNPSGPFDVIGILTQFDTAAPFVDGYQIKPRFTSDVIPQVPGPNFLGNPVATVQDSTTAVITWVTDVASTSLVDYGQTTGLGLTAGDSTAVTNHTVTLTGLTPNRLYYYRVVSCNNLGCRQSSLYTFATPSDRPAQMNFYFNKSVDASLANPDTAAGNADLQARLINFINRATYSLDCAFYSFNAPPVTDALLARWNQGVKVRLVMDAGNSQTQADRLRAVGIPVITSTYGGNHASGGIMHHKFVVADGRDASVTNDWLWTGSTNATTDQLFTDANNSLEIQDFAVTQAYLVEFNEMWGSDTDTPNSSLSRMGNRKTDNTQHTFNVNGTPIEVYFAPSDGVESKYVQYINSADYGIAFSILVFTSDPLADAMQARYNSIPGFYVRGVFDASNVNQQGSEYPRLKGTGGTSPFSPPADVWSSVEAGLLHHKYMIIDEGRTASDPTLITGSYNWSNAANTSNDENSIIFHSQRVANLYMQEFRNRYTLAGGSANFTVDAPGAGAVAAGALTFAAPFPNPATGGGAVTLALTVPQALPAGARAVVNLYSVAGRKVRTLLDAPAAPGPLTLRWDGVDEAGQRVPPGVYLARASLAGTSVERKLVVIP